MEEDDDEQQHDSAGEEEVDEEEAEETNIAEVITDFIAKIHILMADYSANTITTSAFIYLNNIAFTEETVEFQQLDHFSSGRFILKARKPITFEFGCTVSLQTYTIIHPAPGSKISIDEVGCTLAAQGILLSPFHIYSATVPAFLTLRLTKISNTPPFTCAAGETLVKGFSSLDAPAISTRSLNFEELEHFMNHALEKYHQAIKINVSCPHSAREFQPYQI